METKADLISKMEAYMDPFTWIRLGNEMLFIRRDIVEANCELVGRATVMARWWDR